MFKQGEQPSLRELMVPGLGLSQGVLAGGWRGSQPCSYSSFLQKMGRSTDSHWWQRLPELGVPSNRTPGTPSSGEALVFSARTFCVHMGKLRQQQCFLTRARALTPLLLPAKARGVCV